MLIISVCSIQEELEAIALQEQNVQYAPVYENYSPVMEKIKMQHIVSVKHFIDFLNTTNTVCVFKGESKSITDLKKAYEFWASNKITVEDFCQEVEDLWANAVFVHQQYSNTEMGRPAGMIYYPTSEELVQKVLKWTDLHYSDTDARFKHWVEILEHAYRGSEHPDLNRDKFLPFQWLKN